MSTKPEPFTEQPAAIVLALRELLSSPSVKAFLQAGGSTRLAEAAPEMVRTLLWRDVNTSLSLASDLPDLVNALFETLATLAEELERLPEPVLTTLVADRLEAIDLSAARRAGRAWLRLALRLAPGLTGVSPRTPGLTGVSPRTPGLTPGLTGVSPRTPGLTGVSPRTPGLTGVSPRKGAAAPSLILAAAVGRGLLSPLLVAWSRWLADNPQGLRRLADALLAQVEPDMLRKSLEDTAHQLAGVLRDHPALAEAFARLLASLAWETMLGSLRSVGSRFQTS